MLATMGAFIDCEIRSNFQMDASTLLWVWGMRHIERMNCSLLHISSPFALPPFFTG
jgi:hypothetical protein